MMRREDPIRRGAALLIVLATLIITMTAMTILAQAASSVRLARGLEACGPAARDLLIAAEAPIQRWLREDSGKVVLPVDALSPRVQVLDDSWMFENAGCTLAITAFDQCGMVPLEAARGGSPLRLTLPPEVLSAVDSLPTVGMHDPTAIAGVDWFLTQLNQSESNAVFPKSNAGSVLGERVATHNPAPGSININTAPIELVEAALRLASRGGMEQIVAARKAGKSATVGAASPTSTSQDSKFMPKIVPTSTSWSFRIDIRVGFLWHSWWAVYQPSDNSQWACRQRLAITE